MKRNGTTDDHHNVVKPASSMPVRLASRTYEDHIESEEVLYVAEFENYWSKLTPKQRKFLVDHKVEGPVIEFSSVASMDHDAADTPAASYSQDLARQLDTLADELIEKFELSHRTAIPLSAFIIHTIEQRSITYKSWLLGKVCGMILNAKNVKLAAAGLAFASNLSSLCGISSMRAYARQIGVSVEAISKVKRKYQAELNLTDTSHSKSPEACANYSAAQSNGKHWRTKKFTAEEMREYRAGNNFADILRTKIGGRKNKR